MKLTQIITALEKTFPTESACSWDFVGWQVKNMILTDVTKILVTLDINKAVIARAIAVKAELIICHHPLLFASEFAVVSPYKQDLFYELQKNQINVYVMHTNFDKSKKGMNYQIAKNLALNNIEHFDNEKLSIISYNNNLKLTNLIIKIKKYFNLQKVVFFENKKVETINNIVISAGAGGSLIETINNNKIDLFITGEMKWNHCLEAADKKINTLIIGHQMEEKFIVIIEKFLHEINDKSKKLLIIPHYHSLPQFL